MIAMASESANELLHFAGPHFKIVFRILRDEIIHAYAPETGLGRRRSQGFRRARSVG
ncbi:hypothetical protein KL86PLE_40363 [uncultured Pleomorphomonas sp.]|uniref:Uncharacterized protein n=1 Tax=uncultured Pleomorphomonas sp. TaxID=442121 RepID=A0A212LGD9_9HYPH|nr:hypothetical protein KL86PLE_40363 [uncultured Pleomorphomonas sp.]